jgi:superoxide dismutase
MPIIARDFSYLRGHLVGISDRMLVAHLDHYAEEVKRLNAIEAAYPLTDWGESPPPKVEAILAAPIASLDLKIQGALAAAIQQVRKELTAAKVLVAPTFYLGDDDWWTTDRGTSINIPWYLANPTLWRLANRQESTAYSHDEVLKCLRHEIGHVVNYTHELWRRKDWEETFGDFRIPYRDVFPSDPRSEAFVEYLTDVSDHYGQKHPDEDWAETFACWLDPSSQWEVEYGDWSQALDKLRYVDRLAKEGVLNAHPVNMYPGRPESYRKLRGTVGEALGTGQGARPFKSIEGWSEHSELLRQEPEAYNAVRLHELYFEALTRSKNYLGEVPASALGPTGFLQVEIEKTWGSVASYLLDLRAILGTVEQGWALTVWDPRRKSVRNALVGGGYEGVPAGCPILLAIDAAPDAYMMDYGARKDIGMAAAFRNLDWNVVADRLLPYVDETKQEEPEKA